MLIIKNEQIQRFIAGDEDQMVPVIVQAIRRSNTVRVADFDDAELNRMVRIGIERARSHGINAAEDIAEFVAIMFEVAPRFDEQNDIKAVLDNELLPINVKFDHLFYGVPDAAWAEAERKYDDTFWFPDAS